MGRRWTWLVVITAVAVGCGDNPDPQTPIFYVVDDPHMLAAVRDAAAEWERCGKGPIYVSDIPSDDGVHVMRIAESDPELGGRWGLTHWDRARERWTYTKVTSDDREIVVHEMGHVLVDIRPPKNTHFGSGIMKERIEKGEKITAEDCAAVKAR